MQEVEWVEDSFLLAEQFLKRKEMLHYYYDHCNTFEDRSFCYQHPQLIRIYPNLFNKNKDKPFSISAIESKQSVPL